jgi:hypothetical protein
LQPFSRPDIDELVGNRIDVLYSVDLDGAGTKGLRWCQGEVVKVIQNVRQPTVEVKWDPTPDISGFEQGGITNQYCFQLNGIRMAKMVLGEWMLTLRLKVMRMLVTMKMKKLMRVRVKKSWRTVMND